MIDRTALPCGDSPNCVSTEDDREQHHLIAFQLKSTASIDDIEEVALQLSGAKTAEKEGNYLRIECTSSILRFTDDLELKLSGTTLMVRSESRIGYSDFGVNRDRAEELRAMLFSAQLIM
ncbi:hypothetical protein A6E14_02560 [Vibrio genomosp. F10]|uniref:DUF1499 domain-containing protein n=3 Tax=Vibrio genomosp. F10 TaxID=723171 RepID=A0A1B9QWL5_9VIBR|nr:hypothetical protein A6E14_02560 [Vibrio genomosp. F10]OEE31626.1 hypothetical protein A1QO_02135 [Vibrio genomosp. F10 str. ZF-129]OEE93431.1 hypothetical protein A1QK_00340 [Vibrio genomosp. F10 str. 9ZD137]OEE97965.1 hypothetical protein A1QM_13190 [Vibrio genomosp. F10 str. 9ZC157]OEF09446.1 hypothetical protein A1QI_03425 [Vibrio genomosp. F10 str. 9ZB36]